MNILSFGVMLYDKASARDGAWRVSEGALFFLAICFGGLGIYLGMFNVFITKPENGIFI